jgi:hypothetical protein
MAIEVVTTQQWVTLDGVSDVAVSAIAHDDVKGDYYRDITFFGEPSIEGGTIPIVLAIRIRAASTHPLKITVPQDEF